MPNLLARGDAWLAAQQRAHASDRVRYLDTATGSALCVPATVGRTQFELTDAEGVAVQVESRDFIIAAADLELDGVPTEPAVGHRIVDGDHTFEVARFGGEPQWRWAEPARLRYRIHTKQIARAATS